MDFRRKPFQFTAIDPAKRQAELQKRFGLPTTNSDMYVDFLNPGIMGSGAKDPSSISGSPRLQHRVPIFSENTDKVNSAQNNVDGGHKPRVRVVPIQVEGVDGGKPHRTFSGSAGVFDGSNGLSKARLPETFPHLDSTKVEENIKKPNQSRVCNIPIQIEPREEIPNVGSNSKRPEPVKKFKTELNGCASSKEMKEGSGNGCASSKEMKEGNKNGCASSKDNKEEPNKSVPLKQIENVLNKMKVYKEEVEKFVGTSKDKQYRYLDEMLTRCMLDLDNVDTMGLDEIRKARKEAVRQVQHYVDLLDTKVNVSDIPAEASNTASTLSPGDVEKMGGDMNEYATADVEMMSGDMEKYAAADVEMDDEKVGPMTEVTNKKMEVSVQDGKLMDSAVIEISNGQSEASVESPLCVEQDSEIKNCKSMSGIVIEELDSSLESESSIYTSGVVDNESVSCVVSHSPELSVKEAIAEESVSEIVIEENEDDKDIAYSNNICDSSIDEIDSDKKLTIEQLNSVSDFSGVTSTKVSKAPVVQET